MRAGLRAYSAPDATDRAGLLDRRPLVLVDTRDKDPHSTRTLRPQLDDGLRASLDTGSAGGALLLIHDRKTCLGIHRQRAELAGGHTVSAAKAAERAAGVAGVESGLHLAGSRAVIFIGPRPGGAGSGAAHNRHHRSLFLDLVAKDGGHLLHCLVASDRAIVVVQIRSLHRSLRESVAAGETTTTAVSAWHDLLHLLDARILLNLEPLRDNVEGQRQQEAKPRDDCDGPDDYCCHKAK